MMIVEVYISKSDFKKFVDSIHNPADAAELTVSLVKSESYGYTVQATVPLDELHPLSTSSWPRLDHLFAWRKPVTPSMVKTELSK